MTTVAAPVGPANLCGWTREVHIEEVWGTVVTFEIRDEQIDATAPAAIRDAVAFLHQVDRWLSTYKLTSPISSLRMGLATFEEMPPPVQNVLRECHQLRLLTRGTFNPWAVPGGVDPSGYVKGWAADIVANMFVARGFPNVMINAAGDISCRGEQSPGQPWVVAIQHPDDAHSIVTTTEIRDGSIATSGEYERGHHIINPHTGDRVMALRSATVVGPHGGMADALATSLLIAGLPGVAWFDGMPGWSGYLIEGDQAHFFGDAFASGIPAQPGAIHDQGSAYDPA